MQAGQRGRHGHLKVQGIGVDVFPMGAHRGDADRQPGGPLEGFRIGRVAIEEHAEAVLGLEVTVAQKSEVSHLAGQSQRPGIQFGSQGCK